MFLEMGLHMDMRVITKGEGKRKRAGNIYMGRTRWQVHLSYRRKPDPAPVVIHTFAKKKKKTHHLGRKSSQNKLNTQIAQKQNTTATHAGVSHPRFNVDRQVISCWNRTVSRQH